MALRGSAKLNEYPVNLQAIVNPALDIGIPDGDVLLGFASAVVGPDAAALGKARAALVDRLGGDALVASSIIAANFSRNDRLADAIGIPLESVFVEQGADFRGELGFDDFRSARNSLDG